MWLRLSWCYLLPEKTPDSTLFLRFLFWVFFCLFICFFFLWGQNLFFCPPFLFHQLLSYAKSAFHVQLKLCNTHHSIYFILLVAVTTAAPDLSSYLCMVLCVCTHKHATLVYVSSSTDWIRATGYIFLIQNQLFFLVPILTGVWTGYFWTYIASQLHGCI